MLRYLIVVSSLLALGCRYEPPIEHRPERSTTSRGKRAVSSPAEGSNQAHEERPISSQQPLRVGGDVKPPVVIKRVEPDYSLCEGKSPWGFPVLEVVVDEGGEVHDVRLLKPVYPCLEKAIVESVRQWRFRPGTLNGRPVAVVFNMTVHVHYVR